MQGAGRKNISRTTARAPAARKVGVLVIGGGIIGLSIAYHLSKRRYSDVTIVEREKELAMHASGHNASGLVPPRESIAKEFWELHQESLRLCEKLAQSKDFRFDYRVNGYLILKKYDSTTARNGLLRTVQALRARRVNVDFLEGSQLQEVEPNLSIKGGVDSALYYPDGAQGNSKKLATCFARACLKKGVQITKDASVSSFSVNDGKIEMVRTTRGDFSPDTVVLAAGPWSGGIASLLGLNLPVQPAKGHLISVNPRRKNLVRRFVVGPEDYYVTQVPSGELIVGGGVDFVGFDTKADSRRMREAWEEGVSLFPFLGGMKQESAVTCFRPHAPGGIPVLGKSGRFANLVFAAGHHTHGFTLAPVTGELMSQLILDGETEKDMTPFSPARFAC